MNDQTEESREKSATKGDLRRRQIMDAAAQCFRQEGFHGASIARIARLARMSPGHIYHYFPTKDQIVEAIVEAEESELAELIRTLEAQQGRGDLLGLLCSQVEALIERNLRPEYLSLMLEIAAEASRNPDIAAILQRSDQRLAERFLQIARDLSGAVPSSRGDSADLRVRLEILPVLLSGVALRSTHNSAMDRTRIAHLIKDILQFVWSAKS